MYYSHGQWHGRTFATISMITENSRRQLYPYVNDANEHKTKTKNIWHVITQWNELFSPSSISFSDWSVSVHGHLTPEFYFRYVSVPLNVKQSRFMIVICIRMKKSSFHSQIITLARTHGKHTLCWIQTHAGIHRLKRYET